MQQEIFEYQKLDGELRRIKKELEKNEYRVKGKQYAGELKKAEENIAKMETRSVELKNALEATLAASEKIEKAIEEYGKVITEIADEEELNYLKKKIDEQFAALSAAEKECRNVIAASDEIGKKYGEENARLKKVMAGYSECNRHFAAVTKEAEPRIREIQAQQAKLKAVISPETMQLYQRYRATVYPAFVKCDKNICGGCRMEVAAGTLAELREKGSSRCEHCGRLIVDDKR